jgi:hypothetical protein
MRTVLPLLLLLTAIAFAQEGLTPADMPPELRRYLELTEAQANGIQRLNAQLIVYRRGKAERQFQVQRELAEEMARDPLDPTAIGLRHVELESIRRELAAEQTKTVAAIQALFTPAQRTRLDALAQVLRQHDTACAAVAFNLLPAPLWFVPEPTLREGPLTPTVIIPSGTACNATGGALNRWFDVTNFQSTGQQR